MLSVSVHVGPFAFGWYACRTDGGDEPADEPVEQHELESDTEFSEHSESVVPLGFTAS